MLAANTADILSTSNNPIGCVGSAADSAEIMPHRNVWSLREAKFNLYNSSTQVQTTLTFSLPLTEDQANWTDDGDGDGDGDDDEMFQSL